MEKACIIMRGWPGSGKSYKANSILKENKGLKFSTDDFWLDEQGVYVFDRTRIKEAHEWNRRRFQLCAEHQATNLLVVDNTNIKKWEYSPYAEIAEANGYTVYQCVCSGDYNSIHGVPLYIVERMKAAFETDENLPHWEERKE